MFLLILFYLFHLFYDLFNSILLYVLFLNDSKFWMEKNGKYTFKTNMYKYTYLLQEIRLDHIADIVFGSWPIRSQSLDLYANSDFLFSFMCCINILWGALVSLSFLKKGYSLNDPWYTELAKRSLGLFWNILWKINIQWLKDWFCNHLYKLI